MLESKWHVKRENNNTLRRFTAELRKSKMVEKKGDCVRAENQSREFQALCYGWCEGPSRVMESWIKQLILSVSESEDTKSLAKQS